LVDFEVQGMFSINRYIEVTLQLVKKDLKAKYKNTLLGYVWSIGNPLMMAYILNIAFSGVMGVQTKNYILFILTALFAWSWFNIGVVGSSGCFIYNASIRTSG
jgi:lipopolysaccharide transport system permease protein